MTPRITFICGGSWSGKTAHAATLANSYENVVWIGTASDAIPELNDHVRSLQANRPKHWRQINSPFSLTKALEESGKLNKSETIIIDSVSQWISNEIAKYSGKYDERQIIESITRDIDEFKDSILRLSDSRPIYIVSSDYGQSPPPSDPVTRILRRCVGNANIELAAISTHVEILFSGLVIYKK